MTDDTTGLPLWLTKAKELFRTWQYRYPDDHRRSSFAYHIFVTHLALNFEQMVKDFERLTEERDVAEKKLTWIEATEPQQANNELNSRIPYKPGEAEYFTVKCGVCGQHCRIIREGQDAKDFPADSAPQDDAGAGNSTSTRPPGASSSLSLRDYHVKLEEGVD